MKIMANPVRYTLIILALLLLPSLLHAATMDNYCIVPPYVQTEIPPNILLFLDTSCDMSGPAYHYPGGDDEIAGQPQPSYQKGRGYVGLFEPNLYYVHNASPAEWRIAVTQPTLPSNPLDTCNNIYPSKNILTGAPGSNFTCCSDYYCTPDNGTTKYFKGAFMNFISASRFDVMMRVLIGGFGPADATGNINRFQAFAAIPCTANVSCTTTADCTPIFGSESECKRGRCTTSENEWEWIDPVSHCEFEIEWDDGGKEVEFEIEGEDEGICTAGSSEKIGHECHVDADCGSGTPKCTFSNGMCAGGTNNGLACTSNSDCPGGSCKQQCTITGKSDFETEGPIIVAVDRYSDGTPVPSGTVKTTGLVQEFYNRAFWGLSLINSANLNQTSIANCLPTKSTGNPATDNPTVQSFINAISAPGNTPTTAAWVKLATAYNGIVDYFKYNGNATYTGCTGPSKDPFNKDTTACRKNFVLTLSSAFAVYGTSIADATGTCTETRPLVQNSCYAFADNTAANFKRDLRLDITGTQNLYHFGVFTMGQNYENTKLSDTTSCDWNTVPPTPCRLNNKNVFHAATDAGGGTSEGQTQFFEAPQPEDLETAIRNAINAILRRVSSGTAASVLASGEGSGANIIQATFYPKRRFTDRTISWIGSLQNLWYYIDPMFVGASMREDTVSESPYSKLNLSNDKIVVTYYDSAKEATMAKILNNDGSPAGPDIPFENIKSLWEAGKLLWQRDPATRTIYTTTDARNFLTLPSTFPSALSSTLAPYLQAEDLNANGSNVDEAENIIRYTRGEDIISDINLDGVNDYRLRTVTIGTETHVWKLGDVINSTPRIVSWLPANAYDEKYNDTSYKAFLNVTGYKNRGMVFAGANDGMLHAFKLGKFELPNAPAACTFGSDDKACLSGTDLGKEMWSFIPKNVLPYLKYISDPNYCHIFSVDLTPYIVDASIGGTPNEARPLDGSSWRTILIGGMRFGGACRKAGSSCTECVKTPILDPSDSAKGLGYSSYFALNITDPNNPALLWEFSEADIPDADKGLGFATSGPAVVRIGDRSERDLTNGNWYAVFGSGPTGPINSFDYQFMGHSDQNLRLYVIDLKTGTLVRTIDTGVPYAFAGSMTKVTNDSSLGAKHWNYSDDALYVGYTRAETTPPTSTTKWNQGGVGRVLTKEASPASWQWTTFIDGKGPVTTAIDKLQVKGNPPLWLYFGTGRYFFEEQATIDDKDSQRTLYGIKDPCFAPSDPSAGPGGFKASCPPVGSLDDATTTPPTTEPANGWYINLEGSGTFQYLPTDTSPKPYGAERVITNPQAVAATGTVFFTTYKPYADVCAVGGKSFIWAVGYNTGGSVAKYLKGKALLQVSTGSIEQVDLSVAFGQKEPTNPLYKGMRRTGAIGEGNPPYDSGLAVMTSPPPVKRVIHMQER